MRLRASARAFAAFAALLVVAGCRAREQPAPSASARASALSRPSASAPSQASSAPRAASPPPRAGCRVLALRGEKEPGAPKVGDFFDGDGWLELRSGVELSLRHSETTREFTLIGPGKFQACKAGAESVLVARGIVGTSAGPGARPGAEVLLATPFAILRFSDAKLRLEVAEKKLTLGVEQGSATIESDLSAAAAPPKTVSGPQGKFTLTSAVDTEALVSACRTAGPAPGPKPAPSAGSKLGEWAAVQLKARRAARYSCARAHAALARLEGAEHSRLSGLMDGAEPPASPTGDAGK
jgi:hypothetical protein